MIPLRNPFLDEMTLTPDAALREYKIKDFTFASINQTLYALATIPLAERHSYIEKITLADWHLFTELTDRWTTRNVKAYLASDDISRLGWE